MPVKIARGPLATMSHLSKRQELYIIAQFIYFLTLVALVKKYLWLMTIEEIFQKHFCQFTCNDFSFVSIRGLRPIDTF